MASYFMGQAAPLFVLPAIVFRFGYVPMFLVFLLILSTCMAVTPFTGNLFLLMCIRFVSGIAMSGLFLISESWINTSVPNAQRGRVFGLYILLSMGALGGSQFLLTFWQGTGNVMLALSVSFCLIALIPFLLIFRRCAGVGRKVLEKKLLRFRWKGMASLLCPITGIAFGSYFSNAAVYAEKSGYSMTQIGIFVGAAICIGALLQLPVGMISDRFGRWNTLNTALSGTIFVACVMYLVPQSSFWLLCFLSMILGVFINSFYPLSVSIVNDEILTDERVEVSASLLLSFTGGAAIGSLLGGVVIDHFGHEKLMIFLVLVSSAVIISLSIFKLFAPAAPPVCEVCHAPTPLD